MLGWACVHGYAAPSLGRAAGSRANAVPMPSAMAAPSCSLAVSTAARAGVLMSPRTRPRRLSPSMPWHRSRAWHGLVLGGREEVLDERGEGALRKSGDVACKAAVARETELSDAVA